MAFRRHLESPEIPLCLREEGRDVWQWLEYVIKKPDCTLQQRQKTGPSQQWGTEKQFRRQGRTCHTSARTSPVARKGKSSMAKTTDGLRTTVSKGSTNTPQNTLLHTPFEKGGQQKRLNHAKLRVQMRSESWQLARRPPRRNIKN